MEKTEKWISYVVTRNTKLDYNKRESEIKTREVVVIKEYEQNGAH